MPASLLDTDDAMTSSVSPPLTLAKMPTGMQSKGSFGFGFSPPSPALCTLKLPQAMGPGLGGSTQHSPRGHHPVLLPSSSPCPGLLVGHGVLLHDGREPEQGALLEQVELGRGLAVDLQGGRVQAGPVGVLETVPAQLSAGKGW